MLKKAKRFAVRRARKVHDAGGIVDDYYASELVEDVLGDILEGVLPWNPEHERLADYVKRSIKSRARHDAARALRFQHESLDTSDLEAAHATLAAADAALLAAREASAATVTLAEDAFGELVELAAEDVEVMAVLGAFARGATSKADVMLVTQLSDTEYHSARSRLDRLVAKLSYNAQPSRRKLKKGA
jgi:adenylate kinase family enzyme